MKDLSATEKADYYHRIYKELKDNSIDETITVERASYLLNIPYAKALIFLDDCFSLDFLLLGGIKRYYLKAEYRNSKNNIKECKYCICDECKPKVEFIQKVVFDYLYIDGVI